MEQSYFTEARDINPKSINTKVINLWFHMLKYKHLLDQQLSDWIGTIVRDRRILSEEIPRMKTNDRRELYNNQQRLYEKAVIELEKEAKRRGECIHGHISPYIITELELENSLDETKMRMFFKKYMKSQEVITFLTNNNYI